MNQKFLKILVISCVLVSQQEQNYISVAIVIYEALRQQNYRGLLFEEPHKGKDYLEK